MDIRGRIIELLQIDECSPDCDPGFCDDMHYRRLYVKATKEREYRCSEHQRLAGVLRERLSEPPVSLSSPRIMDRSASPDGLILTAEEARQVEVLLRDYEALLAHEKKTREIVADVLVTWELGRDAYRKGKRSNAAQLMNWTTGKKSEQYPGREILNRYIKMTNGDKGQAKIERIEAVKILREKYAFQSDYAVIKFLNRVRATHKRLGISLPAFRLVSIPYTKEPTARKA